MFLLRLWFAMPFLLHCSFPSSLYVYCLHFSVLCIATHNLLHLMMASEVETIIREERNTSKSSGFWYIEGNGNNTNVLQVRIHSATECRSIILWRKKKQLRGLSPRANYTDRATVACWWSYCQLLRIKGATRSAWRIPMVVFSIF
jgi:hypothetical protein